ncbi:DUF5666 domain-containing protein [Pseudomonas sp. H9]|uniref:DUF5666 domain-containing protein n=1 Tax=Pseudomonas sp. H9 TaxID=483968 RepID=UPI001057D6FE|nr:DUF5666 domain-containing protein [Pseudomonas sp. H9]TDF79057.1 hypothetical protein E1573_22660 [Pseudomonas sp. H9]
MITPLCRVRSVAIALGFALSLGLPSWGSAAPACMSRDELGMTDATGLQAPGGIGGTGARPGGTGGTGIDGDNGGVGGSGAPLQKRPGGTGGTGMPLGSPGGTGGTGIVGTITGFASICVNGMEVHFNKDVPVSENGVASSTEHLAIGQVVAVESFATQRGLQAGRIAILNVYEGPLTALPNGSAPLRVMGQPVRLAKGARVSEGLRPGEPVKVSGLRSANGEVVASRIERAPGLKAASAIGSVDRMGSLQGLKLGTRVAAAQEVLVRGQWSGRQLEVAQSRANPSLPFAGRVRDVVVEGLVQGQQNQRLVVGGFNVTLGRDTVFVGEHSAAPALDQRVRVSGVLSGTREVRATRVELNPERAETPARDRSGRNNHEDDEHEQLTDNSGSGKSGQTTAAQSLRSDSNRGGDDRSEREDGGKSVAVDNSGKSERVEKVEPPEKEDHSGRPEKVEKAEKAEKVEKVEKVEKPEKVEKVEKIEKPEKVEKVEKIEKPEKVEKVEKIEKPEKVEKVEKVEKPEKVEKVEKVEKPEKVEKVEKVEKPEKVEKIEKAEKAERPERSGR